MRDYDGDMKFFQKQLDDAGVDYDITNLCGCTQREIMDFVHSMTHFKCPVCKKVYLKKAGIDEMECLDCGTMVEVKR